MVEPVPAWELPVVRVELVRALLVELLEGVQVTAGWAQRVFQVQEMYLRQLKE